MIRDVRGRSGTPVPRPVRISPNSHLRCVPTSLWGGSSFLFRRGAGSPEWLVGCGPPAVSRGGILPKSRDRTQWSLHAIGPAARVARPVGAKSNPAWYRRGPQARRLEGSGVESVFDTLPPYSGSLSGCNPCTIGRRTRVEPERSSELRNGQRAIVSALIELPSRGPQCPDLLRVRQWVLCAIGIPGRPLQRLL